jgi:hypothetical protein
MIQGKPDTFLDVDIKNETLYNDRGNSISTSNCNLKLSGNILSSPTLYLERNQFCFDILLDYLVLSMEMVRPFVHACFR